MGWWWSRPTFAPYAGGVPDGQLKAQGYPVRDEDMARLSPFVSRHLGVHGAYSFLLPDLAPGAIRDLRDPDAPDDEDEA